MVQQTNVVTEKGRDLETQDTVQLIRSFIEMINDTFFYLPEKIILIFENMDHYLSIQEYRKILKLANEVAEKNDFYLLTATSLDGYVYISSENIEAVNIFNSDIFDLTDIDHLHVFLRLHWPYERSFTFEDIESFLSEIMHYIGKEKSLESTASRVLLKLLNKEFQIKDKIKNPNLAEIRFLCD